MGRLRLYSPDCRGVRRRGDEDDRRRAGDRHPSLWLPLRRFRDLQRGPQGSGADRRALDLRARQRGSPLRGGQHSLPRVRFRPGLEALRGDQAGTSGGARGEAPASALLLPLAAAGLLLGGRRRNARRHRGPEVPCLQRDHLQGRRGTGHAADQDRGGRAVAGLRHRRRGIDDLLRLDRYDRKLWEHVDYYYDVKAWLPRNMVIVNLKAWKRLDDNVRAAVTVAAETAESKCWAKARELDQWYVEQFHRDGHDRRAAERCHDGEVPGGRRGHQGRVARPHGRPRRRDPRAVRVLARP